MRKTTALLIIFKKWVLSEKEFLPFLSNPTWARVTVVVVNLWVGIPYTMLVVTGIKEYSERII